MKAKKTEVEEVSPFIQIKAVQRDWVGYDPALLEKACKKGLELERKVRQYEEVSPKHAREKFWTNWGNVGAGAALVAIIGAVAFVICVFVVWGVRSDKWEKGYAAGKSETLTEAITFVESQYRHVDQSQIRLEFPNGTDYLNKEKWVNDHTGIEPYEYPNAGEAGKKYDDLVKQGMAYKIFISPKQ
jgi:hypothetical protein